MLEVQDDAIISTKTYFSVSTPKLILMSVCTLGLYELYWFYKNWVHIKEVNNSKIMPFWRAFFAPLWAYSAFRNIRDKSHELGIMQTLPAGLLAIAYFGLTALWRLPNEYWLLSFLTFLTLLPANTATTKINEAALTSFQQNSRIEGWNWLAIVLGGPLFILGVIGTFMPNPA